MWSNYTNSSALNGLNVYSEWYSSIHGYLSLVICMFGVTSNIFNIIVLTRKHMISSTNVILTALAVSDLVTMLAYVPTSLKYYCLFVDEDECHRTNSQMQSYFWTLYALFYTHFTVTMHSVSIWLTVLLALFRYLYICHNVIGKKVCKMKHTVVAIGIVVILSTLFCFPSYLVSKIDIIYDESDNNTTKVYYELTQSNFDHATKSLIFRATFFIQAFGIKLIPCFLLIILSSLLIRSIQIAKETAKRLQSLGRKKESEKSKEHTRTNIMLVLVCILFFITEFPQGILALFSIIFEKYDFHSNVYAKFGDTMDVLALFNNSINFILYCSMSHLFRRTFKDLFLHILCSIKNLRIHKFPRKRPRNKSLTSNYQARKVPYDVELQPLE